MGDFTLGAIKVIDNGDGVYQSPVKGAKTPQDEVIDLQGNAVKPNGAEAQQALKALGATSLVGLQLSPASRYLEMLSQAKSFAAQGDTFQTQDRLQKARLAALDAKLTFKEDRAASILKTSMEKELDLLAARAPTLADAGDIAALNDLFNAGRELLSRLQVPFDKAKAMGFDFHQDMIDQTSLKAYTKAIPLEWTKAEAAAKAGEVPPCREAIGKVRAYAVRAQVSLTADEEKKLADLERQAYAASVETHLKEAAAFAAQGDVDNTRVYLGFAKDAALLGNTPLTTKQTFRIKQEERTALRNAPDFLLPQAELSANLGDVPGTRALIQQAKDARAQIGLGLNKSETARAEVAEQNALRFSVDVLLADAANAVAGVKKNGNLSLVRSLITQARENAALAKVTLSAAQESSITSILKQAYQAAVDWRFAQARGAAGQGKVDDTIVPLNAARELAKQGGLSFDETAAQKWIDTALTNGIELEFSVAEKFAVSGDRESTILHLDTARDNAKRLGQKFDETRAAEILKLLPWP